MKKNLIIGIGAAIAASALAIGCVPSPGEIAMTTAEHAGIVQSCDDDLNALIAMGMPKAEAIERLEFGTRHLPDGIRCEFDR